MIPSKPLSGELQSSNSERLVRRLAAHMPCAALPASSSCSAVPNPHFGSVDTLRTGRDRQVSAVAVDDSSAPSPPLLASKPLPLADVHASSAVLPALAHIAGDDEFLLDAVDSHSIDQKTDSDSCASATGFHNSSSLAGPQPLQTHTVSPVVGAVAPACAERGGAAATEVVLTDANLRLALL